MHCRCKRLLPRDPTNCAAKVRVVLGIIDAPLKRCSTPLQPDAGACHDCDPSTPVRNGGAPALRVKPFKGAEPAALTYWLTGCGCFSAQAWAAATRLAIDGWEWKSHSMNLLGSRSARFWSASFCMELIKGSMAGVFSHA